MNQEIQILEQALKLHQAGSLNDAAVLYQSVIKLNPHQADALYLYGVLQHQQGCSQEAIDLFKKALEFTSDKVNVLYNLANIYFEQSQIEQAIATYLEVLRLQPDHLSSLNNIGSIFTKKDPQQAIGYLSHAYRLNPNQLQPLQNLAISLDLIGQSTDAFELLRQHFVQYQSQLSYYNTITSILHGLSYNKLTNDQKNFLQDLYKSNLVCHDKLNQIVRDLFIKSVQTVIESNDLNSIDVLVFSYLRLGCIASKKEETAFNQLRKHLLQNHKQLLINQKVNYLTLLDAVACQIFKLEFSSNLGQAILNKLNSFDQYCTYFLLLKACFYKLSIKELSALDPIYCSSTIKSYQLEQNILSSQIDTTLLANDTSLKVSAQYEENPYPKWCYVQRFTPKLLSQFLLERVSKTDKVSLINQDTSVLIAGCGTGKVLCEVLTQIHYNKAYGIYLSLTSLQYAKHNVLNFNLKNVLLKKLDILHRNTLNESFDYIDCSGVLHHMKDPQEGLSALVNVLSDNGFMTLALYSKIARRHINIVRNEVKDLPPTHQNIIELRQRLLELDKHDPRANILNSSDFYSTSGCRDLLFNVCEHQYDLLEIQDILDKNNLEFCGFDFSNPNYLIKYLNRFPQDKQAINLNLWHQFEQENPDFFLAMYQFFVCKKAR